MKIYRKNFKTDINTGVATVQLSEGEYVIAAYHIQYDGMQVMIRDPIICNIKGEWVIRLNELKGFFIVADTSE